ncbi:MAG: S46 family peptidase [Brumimicrobium sp.]|nr:S46 family peptidase [Brumimicrobium sp.]
MKKFRIILLISFVFSFSFAEEGMIIPSILEAFESDMKAMGMKISAQDIYDVNNSSIKDAIIHFGGGCTSEIISTKGLILTNYHCGYSQIYAHSTVENNIADKGFWAKSLLDELPNLDLTATRIVRIQDVTALVLRGVNGLSNSEAYQLMQKNMALIKAEATKGTYFEAEVKAFDFGNSYFLMVKETFKDVRLVGAPPKTIGKFGGDTDNWVWPRHTGDFSVFRIYVDKNNQPAEYSTENIPYTPLYHLPISLKDREDNEFSMIFGFPGFTEQHTISTELSFIIDTLRPTQIKMRDLSIAVMDEAMRHSQQVEINYAPKQARVANAWKKWQGQILGLKAENALEKKITYEETYINKVKENPEWEKKYGKVVDELRKLSNQYNKADFIYNIYSEYAYSGAEVFDRARVVDELLDLYRQGKKEELSKAIEKQKQSLTGFYNKYNASIDGEIFLAQTEYYKSIIDINFLPPSMIKNTPQKLKTTIYSKSFLVNQKKFLDVLEHFEKYAKKKIAKDPGYLLFTELEDIFVSKLLGDLRIYYSSKNQLMKEYVAGKYEMFPQDKHWADANNTMRLSYGKVEGSYPKDGMHYTSHTTLKGIIEKNNTGLEDFELEPRMLELFNQKKYGAYAQNGELWVCFTSSLHTTGGNSGSPVIDGNGYLIGINFDRSWESTMSDYFFDSSRCRNISVDIRYVLWVIDIYGEASHLINEMTLIK